MKGADLLMKNNKKDFSVFLIKILGGTFVGSVVVFGKILPEWIRILAFAIVIDWIVVNVVYDKDLSLLKTVVWTGIFLFICLIVWPILFAFLT